MKSKSYLNAIAATAVALVLGAAAPAALAQFQAGDRELQFTGGLFHQQGSDEGTLTIDATYGVFVTPNWSAGVQQTLSYGFNDKASDYWVASTTGFANYHFILPNSPKMVPFVGAFVGGIYDEDDISGTIGPALGVKYFVSDSTFVLARYRYEWAFSELTSNSVDRNSGDGNHIVTVGFGYRF